MYVTFRNVSNSYFKAGSHCDISISISIYIHKHKNCMCEPAQHKHKHKHKKMENFPFSYANAYSSMLRYGSGAKFDKYEKNHCKSQN